MKRTNRVVINGAGTPINGATVDVFLTGTETAATIYSDEGVTSKANPLTTDSLGRFWYYAEDGRYDHKVSGTGLTTYTETDVEVADMKDLPVTMAHMYTAGANAGAKILLAINDLPSTGGTVDARGFEGAQTIATDVFTAVTKNVTLLWGAGTYNFTLDTTIPANITQIAIQGTVLAPASGKTLTINSDSFEAPEASAFGGAGTVTFGGMSGNAASLPLSKLDTTVPTGQTNSPIGMYRKVIRATTSGTGGGLAAQDATGGFFRSEYTATGKGSGLWGVVGQTGHDNTDAGSEDVMGFAFEGEVFNNKAVNSSSWWSAVNANGVATNKVSFYSAPKGTHRILAHFFGEHNAANGSNRPIFGVEIQDAVEAAYKAGSADWAEQANTTLLMTNAFVADPPRKASAATTTRDSFPILLRGAAWTGSASRWHGYKILFDSTGDDLGRLSFQYLPAYATTSSESALTERAYLDEAGNFVADGSITGSGFVATTSGIFIQQSSVNRYRLQDESGSLVLRNQVGTDKYFMAFAPTGDAGNDTITIFGGPNQGTAPTLTVAGITTFTGGIVATGRSRYSTVPVGSVAYASFGTDTTPVAGTIYWADISIPRNVTLTGVAVLNGSVAGTDKYIVALYNSAGTLVANSALAGTTTSGTNAFQSIAFTGTYAAVGPARYWIAVQVNGTTDRFRSVAVSTFIDVLTDSDTGVFGTLTALTPPTTFTADIGPIAYVYA